MPSCVIRAAIAPSRIDRATSACSRATIFGDVPAGACKPIMVAMLKPVSPSSSQVMIVGVDDERCKVLTQPEGAISRTGRVGQTSSCALTGELLASDTTQATAVAIFPPHFLPH